MSLWALASEGFFRALETAERWAGLPKKVEASLHFRNSFRDFLPAQSPTGKTLWIHGASVGELEDLAAFFLSEEALRESGWRAEQIVLTASSISARERLAKWRAERPFLYAGPLPPEKPAAVADFLDRLRPALLILSHNDVWPRLIEAVHRRGQTKILWLPTMWPTPGLLKESFLRPKVFVVGTRSPQDASAAERDDFRASFVGHTRIDRILTRLDQAQRATRHPLEERNAQPDPTRLSILLGSVWPEDAELWGAALRELDRESRARLFLVAIPHEVSDAHLVARIQHALPAHRIVAQEGLLLEAYRGFDLTYVGGGLGRGLHSVVEPVLWGLPTISGPVLRAQPLAPRFVGADVQRLVRTPADLAQLLKQVLLEGHTAWKRRAEQLGQSLRDERGATQRLAHLIRNIEKAPRP